MNKMFQINLINITIPKLIIKRGGDKKIEVASGKNSKGIIQLQVRKESKKLKNI